MLAAWASPWLTASGLKLGPARGEDLGPWAGIKIGKYLPLGRDLVEWAEWRPEWGFRPWEMRYYLWYCHKEMTQRTTRCWSGEKTILEDDYNSISFKKLRTRRNIFTGKLISLLRQDLLNLSSWWPFGANVNRLASGLRNNLGFRDYAVFFEGSWVESPDDKASWEKIVPNMPSHLSIKCQWSWRKPPILVIFLPSNPVTGAGRRAVWCIYGAEPI